MYAQVQMQFPTTAPTLLIPATALVIRAEGPQLMVVDSGKGKERSTSARCRWDATYGATIEILGGVDEGARIVTNPTTELTEGMHVQVVAAPAAPPASK